MTVGGVVLASERATAAAAAGEVVKVLQTFDLVGSFMGVSGR